MAGKTRYKVGDEFHGTKRIVEYVGSHPKHRVSLWMWECMGCGTLHGPSMTATLTRMDREGSLPRCCYRLDLERNPRWMGCGKLPYTYYSQIKYGATKRGIEFDLTIEDMWEAYERQGGRCAYSNAALKLGYKDIEGSLDRIDNSKGYVEGNIQWVHKDINKMKSDLSEKRFLELCKAIASNNI